MVKRNLRLYIKDLIILFSCSDSHVKRSVWWEADATRASPPMMYPEELDDFLHREFLDAGENETQKFIQLKNMRDASETQHFCKRSLFLPPFLTKPCRLQAQFAIPQRNGDVHAYGKVGF